MKRRVWLFFLAILIIILYCISWRPAICQVLDTTLANRLAYGLSPAANLPTVSRFGSATETMPRGGYDFIAADNQLFNGESANNRQPVPRPDSGGLRPFGYDIFADNAQGLVGVDQYMAPDEYILGPGDHLLLNVWGRVDLSFDLLVDREGKIFIPRAGEIIVHGITITRAEKRIHATLSSVYSDFELDLMLGRLRSMTIFVFGEVRRPGAFTVSSLTTMFNALYVAGGPNTRGSLRHVKLQRRDKTIEEIDFYEFLLSGRRGHDPRLLPGDVVFVSVVGPRVTVRGEVKRPGIYELKNGERLTSVITLAGGVTAEAYLHRVMIDRVAENDGRQLLDIDYTKALTEKTSNIRLNDGDDISVFSIFDVRGNIVWLEGAARRPGAFERFDSMTVFDLIGGGTRLAPHAYAKRADLERTAENGATELIPINLGALCAGAGEHDVLLQNGDRLIIYDRELMLHQPTVFIDGVVKSPGSYELLNSMRLSDLIFRAGNLQKNAYLMRAEIVRHQPGGERQLLTVDLRDILIRHDLSADVLLAEDDHVFIRENPEYSAFSLVTIDGQVRFPGRFALLNPEETLYDLIRRAGGLTPQAFAEGTIFTRAKISADLQRQGLANILLHSQPIIQDSTGAYVRQELLQFDPEQMTRILLDVPALLARSDGENDIILQDGDHIYIPETPSGIQLLGAVASPGTIKHRPGWRVKDYLKGAGGLTSAADHKALRLIRANGQVFSGRGVSRRRVGLGDAVFVPPKIKKEKDWLRFLTSATTILTGAATTWFLIDRVSE